MRQWYPVREHKWPHRIIGFLLGDNAERNIRRRSGNELTIKAQKFNTRLYAKITKELEDDASALAAFMERGAEMAIDAQDYPIEWWRALPDFVEAAVEDEEIEPPATWKGTPISELSDEALDVAIAENEAIRKTAATWSVNQRTMETCGTAELRLRAEKARRGR